MGGAMKV